MHPSKILDFTTQKNPGTELIWIPQKSSYRLRHFNSRLPPTPLESF